MDITIVKQHPYATGAVVVFVLVVIYAITHRQSSSASSPDISGGDVSLANASAATTLATAQSNAQITMGQIQGQVATTQIQAELEASNKSQDTALAIVNAQANRDIAVEQSKDNASVQVATLATGAATQIATTNANAALGIAATQADVAKAQISSINDVTKTLGTQKQLGSKIVGVIAAMQGPQAIAANQPTQVAQVNSDAANSPAGILSILNPAKLLGAFSGLFG